MTKIKNFSQQKPVLFSLVICCISFLFLKGSGLLFSVLPDNTLMNVVDELFCMLWPVALSLLCGFRFIYMSKGFGSTLKAGMAVFVWYLFTLVVNILNAVLVTHAEWQTFPVILVGVLAMIGIGVREEVIFRGIIGNSLALKHGTDKKGLWFAVLVSSALFGIVHITNIFNGVEVLGLIAQIIGAFAAGLLYTAIYLRGGNIWFLVLIHALTDAAGLFVSTFTVTTVSEVDQVSNLNIVGALILVCVDICLSLFLLRKSKLPAVLARLEQMRAQV
ncbi:MAG: CPBP family intramembrane metalloprotease [Clostridia bacterium]|nr:CPBP family intramembrane metalloprotease [Clostridia bacterium]